MRTYLKAARFVGSYKIGQRQGEWVAMLYWRLGFRGMGLVTAPTERELWERLLRLDPSVQISARGLMFE